MAKSKSLSRSISQITGAVSTAAILFTGLTFSMAYYFLVQHDTRSLLVKEATEILQEQITYTNNISYRQNPPGETLAMKLQNFNLSAVILDTKLQPIASFGVYQGLSQGKNYSDYASITALNSALTSGKTDLNTHFVPGNQTYETFVAPITFNNKTVGVLVLSRPYEFVNHLFQLNLIVLAFSIPLSLIFGWIISATTIKSSFAPLRRLIAYLQGVEFNSRLSKLEFSENPGEEIVALTNAFNEMVARVGDSLDKQKDFIAHASHELKTPLTQAISSLDLAQETSDPKYITQVREDLLTLNHILDGLLDMSKVSSPIAPVIPAEKIIIINMINDAVRLYTKSATQKHLTLKINVSKIDTLFFPPEHFRILISNLISNAIKYNIQNGSITISWSDNTLKVTDTGIGMNSEEKAHMFDRFYRGRAKTSTVRGTGLGLALVKLIADQHHLQIEVVSSPHHGTSISILFPSTNN